MSNSNELQITSRGFQRLAFNYLKAVDFVADIEPMFDTSVLFENQFALANEHL